VLRTRRSRVTDPNSLAYKLHSHDPLSAAAQVGPEDVLRRVRCPARASWPAVACHDPDHAYAPPNALAVQPGGKSMQQFGTRAVPSLRYKEYVPPLRRLVGQSRRDQSSGTRWAVSRRMAAAATIAEQAKIPLLSAQRDGQQGRCRTSLRRSAGQATPSCSGRPSEPESSPTRRLPFKRPARRCRPFQMEDYSFHPYSSKYDLYAANKIGGDLTAAGAPRLRGVQQPEQGELLRLSLQRRRF